MCIYMHIYILLKVMHELSTSNKSHDKSYILDSKLSWKPLSGYLKLVNILPTVMDTTCKFTNGFEKNNHMMKIIAVIMYSAIQKFPRIMHPFQALQRSLWVWAQSSRGGVTM